MKWLRLYSDFATNPKIQVVTEALQRRYVMLLCMQCDGTYKNAPDDEIALALRISIDDWIDTKKTFIERKLLNPDGSIYGWEKRQYISDLKDSTAAERQRRYRENKRNNRNAAVTQNETLRPDTDTDTDTDTEKDILSGKPDPKPPKPKKSIEQEMEVLAYLNNKTGKDFRPVNGNISLITSRLKEGFSVDDMKQVIDDRNSAWSGDQKMEEYLRPKTLFNSTNFSNYAASVGKSANSPKPWEVP